MCLFVGSERSAHFCTAAADTTFSRTALTAPPLAAAALDDPAALRGFFPPTTAADHATFAHGVSVRRKVSV